MAKPDLQIKEVASFLQCAPEPSEIADALSRYCHHVFEVEELPGSIIPYHSHSQEETVVVLEGALRLNVEENLSVIEEGHIAVIRENAVHAYASVGKSPARVLIGLSGGPLPASRETSPDDEPEEDFPYNL